MRARSLDAEVLMSAAEPSRLPDVPAPARPAEPSPNEEPDREASLVAMAQQGPFGPIFFLEQLGAFVREKCPQPTEGLPVVEIHLAEGEVLDLCHVIGVAPTWVALAVNEVDAGPDDPRMRTELVPFGRIVRVTVRASRRAAPEIGFSDRTARNLFAEGSLCIATPEQALRAAAVGPAS
jgi:hypothetical protein